MVQYEAGLPASPPLRYILKWELQVISHQLPLFQRRAVPGPRLPPTHANATNEPFEPLTSFY